MLADFILANGPAIIARAKDRVAARPRPRPSEAELEVVLPAFLAQLVDALLRRRTSAVFDHSEIGVAAGIYGQKLHGLGCTIAQVVHDYGDVCQVITDLALEQDVALGGREFQTLNLCLDDAIASAVTEFAERREREVLALGQEHLAVLSHELRNLLNTAMLSYEMIKTGRVSSSGSTSLVLERSLSGLHDLIARSLADVRLDAGLERLAPINVATFLEEVEIAAMLQAAGRKQNLTVARVDHAVTIEGDAQILGSAIANLLQNAFKFTPKGGHVALVTRVTADRVMFEVEDECGGLPSGAAEGLFKPFEQRSKDRSGLGLGLAVCRKAAKASHGEIRVRDLPGKGCVFTLDLPRAEPPAPKLKVRGSKPPPAGSVPPSSKRARSAP